MILIIIKSNVINKLLVLVFVAVYIQALDWGVDSLPLFCFYTYILTMANPITTIYGILIAHAHTVVYAKAEEVNVM